MAVFGSNGQRRQIVEASETASAQGVHCGMTLAEARALCPSLTYMEHDPVADARAFEALGRWMMCFTPVVATGWRDEDATAPTPRPKSPRKPARANQPIPSKASDTSAPAVLFLDVTGSERLFGSTTRLVERVRRAMRRFGIPSHIAAAPTAGAAWALASAGEPSSQVVGADELHAALSPLPITSLRLNAHMAASLHHLGLRTIGQLLGLPRDELPARFGPTLLLRLDQAFGARPETLEPLSYEAPVEARIDLEGPVVSQEAIWAVFQAMLRQVIGDLARRGRGASQIDLICKSDAAWARPDVTKVIRLSRPSRDFASLFNLIRCATEQLDGGREGFVSFRMRVPMHERITDEQTSFVGGEGHRDSIEFDRLVERLRARLGDSAVIRPMLVESYLPERAWKPIAENMNSSSMTTTSAAASSSLAAVERLMQHSRPLHLLATPVEVRVISEPFDSSDASPGWPRQFILNRQVYQLTVVVGPERIAGEWWRGHRRTRDYYEVEETSGLRFWLFRVVRKIPINAEGESGQYQTRVRWFVHGRFE